MAPRISTELENALAQNPAARERFWALPPEQKDAWVAFVERGRFPGARRRRAADAARRLGAPAPAVEEGAAAAPVALPRNDWGEWLIGLALLAGLAAFLLWLTVFRHHDDKKSTTTTAATATVPKVTGIAVQSAKFQLQAAKLGSKVTRLAAAKPKGIVIAQAPKPDTTVPRGTAVALVVSNGPGRVAMPKLVGLPKAAAVHALQANGLTPTVQEVASKQPPGTVLAQIPGAGKTLAPGAAVTLKVSKGAPKPTTTTVATTTTTTTTAATTTTAKTTTTPAGGNDYTGMRLRDAVKKIADGRQQVVVQYVTSSTPAGVVISNSKAGARVRLQVSLGTHPKPAKDVPDTTNEDAATAQQDLTTAGFAVIQVSWPVSDAAMDGVVVYQTPTGQIAQGAAIVIYVGSSSGG
jgi:beta-lactam-binding protein with PASTA domain